MVRATSEEVHTNDEVRTNWTPKTYLPVVSFRGRLASRAHDRANFAEYRADALGDARHNGAGRHRYEPSHEGVFDEILSEAIAPSPQEKKKGSIINHLLFLLMRFSFRNRYVMCTHSGLANGVGQSGR
jgi:hypothetical protein